jgi:hypothetical protein
MPPLGRVLVADDEPPVGDVLRDALIDLGYHVETADRARRADVGAALLAGCCASGSAHAGHARRRGPRTLSELDETVLVIINQRESR